jgi:hypothetical protein
MLGPVLLAQAPAPNLDQLLAKHFEAEGGLAKRKALKSMRITGKVVGSPMEVKIVTEHKRPSSFRVDVNVQGQTQSTAFDGKGGWKVNPFAGYGGGKGAEPMTADEIKDAEIQADMDGPLVDYAAKGHKVEYAGTEAVEGSPAHKIKVTLKTGNTQVSYLDTDSFLKVKETNKRMMRGQEVEIETLYGDYKEVNGFMVPHSIEQGMPGNPQRGKFQIEKVELNIDLDDARFRMPVVEKKPEAPKAEPAKTEPPKAEPKKN